MHFMEDHILVNFLIWYSSFTLLAFTIFFLSLGCPQLDTSPLTRCFASHLLLFSTFYPFLHIPLRRL